MYLLSDVILQVFLPTEWLGEYLIVFDLEPWAFD